MFDYRPYIIAIAAIFLALASGILIGITFGEDVLVSNQKEMIEFMQHQLTDLQDNLACQQSELKRWQGLAPLVIKSFKGSLSGKKILVLTADNPLTEEMLNLLQESGAETCLVELPARPPLKLDPQTAHAFAGELAGEQGIEACTGEGYAIRGGISGRPDCIILYLSPGPALPGQLFLRLLGEELLASGSKIIAAFPESRDGGGERLFSMEPTIIEHLNTFWGKLTLLEILLENTESVYSTD